jgi:O-antigen ligase
LFIGLTLFLTSAAVGAASAPQPSAAWVHFGGIFVAAGLALAVAALPSTQERRAGWGVGLLSGLLIAFGIAGAFGAPWARNTVGGVAAMGLPFALAALYRPPGGTAVRVSSGGAAALLMVMLMFSRSRGALLGGLVATVVVALWWASRGWGRQRLPLFFAMLGVVGLGISGLLIAAWPWVAPLIDGVDVGGSDMGRLSIWRETLYLIAQAPLTGWGGSTFEGAYALYGRLISVPLYSYAHHLYLGIAFEQGVGGLLIWLGLWVIAVVTLLRADGSGADPYRLATLASAVTLGVHGLMDDPVLAGGALPFLFMWAGFAALFGRAAPVRPSAVVKGSHYRAARWLFAGLLGLVLAFAAGASSQLRAIWHTNRAIILLSAQELAAWPVIEPVSDPTQAQAEFGQALALDPAQVAARFRRGLLALNTGDYVAARADLEQAYAAAPESRAMVKALGYARLWSGDIDAAADLLGSLPEVSVELEAYRTYWADQGQSELSRQAELLARRLVP